MSHSISSTSNICSQPPRPVQQPPARQPSPLPYDQLGRLLDLTKGTYPMEVPTGDGRPPLKFELSLPALFKRFHELLGKARVQTEDLSLIGSGVIHVMTGEYDGEKNKKLRDLDFSIRITTPKDGLIVKNLFLQALAEEARLPKGEKSPFENGWLKDLCIAPKFTLFTLPTVRDGEPFNIDITIVWEPETSCFSSADCFQADLTSLLGRSRPFHIKTTDGYDFENSLALLKNKTFYVDPVRAAKLFNGLRAYVRLLTKGLRPRDPTIESVFIKKWETDFSANPEKFWSDLPKYIERHYGKNPVATAAFFYNLRRCFEVSNIPQVERLDKECLKLLGKGDSTPKHAQLLQTLLYWRYQERAYSNLTVVTLPQGQSILMQFPLEASLAVLTDPEIAHIPPMHPVLAHLGLPTDIESIRKVVLEGFAQSGHKVSPANLELICKNIPKENQKEFWAAIQKMGGIPESVFLDYHLYLLKEPAAHLELILSLDPQIVAKADPAKREQWEKARFDAYVKIRDPQLFLPHCAKFCLQNNPTAEEIKLIEQFPIPEDALVDYETYLLKQPFSEENFARLLNLPTSDKSRLTEFTTIQLEMDLGNKDYQAFFQVWKIASTKGCLPKDKAWGYLLQLASSKDHYLLAHLHRIPEAIAQLGDLSNPNIFRFSQLLEKDGLVSALWQLHHDVSGTGSIAEQREILKLLSEPNYENEKVLTKLISLLKTKQFDLALDLLRLAGIRHQFNGMFEKLKLAISTKNCCFEVLAAHVQTESLRKILMEECISMQLSRPIDILLEHPTSSGCLEKLIADPLLYAPLHLKLNRHGLRCKAIEQAAVNFLQTHKELPAESLSSFRQIAEAHSSWRIALAIKDRNLSLKFLTQSIPQLKEIRDSGVLTPAEIWQSAHSLELSKKKALPYQFEIAQLLLEKDPNIPELETHFHPLLESNASFTTLQLQEMVRSFPPKFRTLAARTLMSQDFMTYLQCMDLSTPPEKEFWKPFKTALSNPKLIDLLFKNSEKILQWPFGDFSKLIRPMLLLETKQKKKLLALIEKKIEKTIKESSPEENRVNLTSLIKKFPQPFPRELVNPLLPLFVESLKALPRFSFEELLPTSMIFQTEEHWPIVFPLLLERLKAEPAALEHLAKYLGSSLPDSLIPFVQEPVRKFFAEFIAANPKLPIGPHALPLVAIRQAESILGSKILGDIFQCVTNTTKDLRPLLNINVLSIFCNFKEFQPEAQSLIKENLDKVESIPLETLSDLLQPILNKKMDLLTYEEIYDQAFLKCKSFDSNDANLTILRDLCERLPKSFVWSDDTALSLIRIFGMRLSLGNCNKKSVIEIFATLSKLCSSQIRHPDKIKEAFQSLEQILTGLQNVDPHFVPLDLFNSFNALLKSIKSIEQSLPTGSDKPEEYFDRLISTFNDSSKTHAPETVAVWFANLQYQFLLSLPVLPVGRRFELTEKFHQVSMDLYRRLHPFHKGTVDGTNFMAFLDQCKQKKPELLYPIDRKKPIEFTVLLHSIMVLHAQILHTANVPFETRITPLGKELFDYLASVNFYLSLDVNFLTNLFRELSWTFTGTDQKEYLQNGIIRLLTGSFKNMDVSLKKILLNFLIQTMTSEKLDANITETHSKEALVFLENLIAIPELEIKPGNVVTQNHYSQILLDLYSFLKRSPDPKEELLIRCMMCINAILPLYLNSDTLKKKEPYEGQLLKFFEKIEKAQIIKVVSLCAMKSENEGLAARGKEIEQKLTAMEKKKKKKYTPRG